MTAAGDDRRLALGTLLPGFSGTELPEPLEALLREGLAGVCLFGENIIDDRQVRALTDRIRAANPAAVIAVDEEGGDVTRLSARTGSPYPGNAILGRIDDVAVTEAVGAAVARRLASVGIGLNFAPDVDVNANPDNPVIGVRSFGADAELVARHASAWTRGHERAGVATSAKHFPGHGDTAQDSHLALPTIDASRTTLESRELPPFAAAIAAGARTVMSSHILVPSLDDVPATFSSPILGGTLRSGLGFAGAVVSDALDMRGASGGIGIPAAAVRALAGGCDLLCIGTRTTADDVEAIVAAIAEALASGELGRDRLVEAAGRVAELAASTAGTVPAGEPAAGPGVDAEVSDAAVAAAGDSPVSAEAVAAVFEERTDAPPTPAGAPIVQLETTPNIAVGRAPWGPASAGADVVHLSEGGPLPGSGPWILVGAANHRYPWVREVIDSARQRHPETLVVDTGWPSPDRAYADIATFGGSRLAGQALLIHLAKRGESEE